MTPLWWSILLAVVGILGLLLAGSKRKIGWAIGFGAQALWVVFAVVTGQYGFILSAVAYAVVYARNWWLWRRAEAAVMDENGYTKADRKKYGMGEYQPRDERGVPILRRSTPPTVGPKGPAGNSGVAINALHSKGCAYPRRPCVCALWNEMTER